MKHILILSLLSALFMGFAVQAFLASRRSADAYVRYHNELTLPEVAKERVTDWLGWFTQLVTQRSEFRARALKNYRTTMIADRKRATAMSFVASMAVAAMALYAGLLRSWVRDRGQRYCGLILITLAASCFGLGVTMPLISWTGYAEIPYIGRVYKGADSKSILGSIPHLWASNPFPSVLVVLFSLVVPTIKIGLVYLAELMPTGTHRRLHSIASALGRWSMVEMYLVANLLLVFNMDGFAEARIEHGVYFYTAHTLLSVMVGQLLTGTPTTAKVREGSS